MEIEELIKIVSQIEQQAAGLTAMSEQALVIARGLINPVTRHMLAIPWIGQNTPALTDDWSNSDCGPACLAMWLNYAATEERKQITVDEASAATGLARGYRYTLPGNLIVAASHWRMLLERVTGLTPDTIKAEIDKGRPVIVLVHYGSIPWRSDPIFTGGHWLLVIGYDEQGVIYHDPYWQDGKGASLVMSYAQFIKAMADCALDGNAPNQGLRQAT